MKIKGVCSEYVLTGMPAILMPELIKPTPESPASLIIEQRGETVYTGRLYSSSGVDISEVLSTVAFRPDVYAFDQEPLATVVPMSELEAYAVTCLVEQDGKKETISVIPFSGGVPSLEAVSAARLGGDVFSKRFLANGRNRFFTTRTAGRIVEMTEYEAGPLYFLVKEPNSTIEVTDVNTGYSLLYERMDNGVLGICFDKMRREFFDYFETIANAFEISIQGVKSATVVITHTCPAEWSARLVFRNSYGFFETVGITGDVGFNVDTDDIEVYTEYAPERGSGMEVSLLSSVSASASALLDPVSPLRLPSFVDMLMSDEVYLEANGCRVRVLVTSEDVPLKDRPTVPAVFTLKMQMSLEERYATPYANTLSGDGDGLFASMFGNEFD